MLRIRAVVLTCLITACCFEAAALAFVALRQGRFHYATSPVYAGPSWQGALPAMRLHPYFGFFSETTPFPPLPRPGEANASEVLVGVFGGSVAQGYYFHEALNNSLRDALQAMPRHAGRTVRVLNFAHPGYKQPQQLHVLTHYLSLGLKLDVAICIDGVNEIGFHETNREQGLDESMPIGSVFGDLIRQCQAGDFRDPLLCEKAAAQRMAVQRHEAALEAVTALGYCLELARGTWAERRYWKLADNAPAGDRNASSLVSFAPSDPGLDDAARLRRAVDLWLFTLRSMHQTAALGGALLLEFVQPNQYHNTARVLTREEIYAAWSERSVLADSVDAGYRLFLGNLDALRAEGVRVHDMTRVFDQVPETIYTDTCCHFNDRGYELVSDYVVNATKAALGGAALEGAALEGGP